MKQVNVDGRRQYVAAEGVHEIRGESLGSWLVVCHCRSVLTLDRRPDSQQVGSSFRVTARLASPPCHHWLPVD